MLIYISIYSVVFLGFFLASIFTDDSTPNDWRIVIRIMIFARALYFGVVLGVPICFLYYFFIESYIPAETFIPIVFIMVLLLSYYLVRPAPPLNYKKEKKKRDKQMIVLFEKYSPIVPDQETKRRDVAFLKEEISNLLTGFDFGNNNKISEEDKNHFEKVDRFIGTGFAIPRKQISTESRLYRLLMKASKTLEFHFISYSPDGRYFVSFFSFRRYETYYKCDIDSSRIIFGEKVDKQVHLYQYKSLFGSISKDNEDKYKFFTGWDKKESIINNLDKFSLNRLYDYPKYNPMDPLFWKDPNFFRKVTILDKEYLRFKTYNQINTSTIDYHLREKLVLNCK